MDFEFREIVHKCCCCIDLKVGATLIIFWHATSSATNLVLLQQPGTVRFYVACTVLSIFTALIVPYVTGVWFLKKSIYQAPLLVFYVISVVVVNVMVALPGDEKKLVLSEGHRLILDVVLGVVWFFLDVYFVCVLYSLFIRMRREELDVLRQQ